MHAAGLPSRRRCPTHTAHFASPTPPHKTVQEEKTATMIAPTPGWAIVLTLSVSALVGPVPTCRFMRLVDHNLLHCSWSTRSSASTRRPISPFTPSSCSSRPPSPLSAWALPVLRDGRRSSTWSSATPRISASSPRPSSSIGSPPFTLCSGTRGQLCAGRLCCGTR